MTPASQPVVSPAVAPQSVAQHAAAPSPRSPANPPHPHQTAAAAPPSNTLLLAAQSILVIIVVAVFIITFAVQPFRIPSSSMVPTLLVGDFLLVDKQTANRDGFPLPPGTLHRGDVIVFRYPPNPSMHLVKRVIGLPGDRVRLRGNQVFINGEPITEPYAIYRPSPPDAFRDEFPHLTATDPDVNAHWWMQMRHLVHDGQLTIPPGQYFVLGDNRNNSEDSRYWGLVPAGDVVGKPLLVYLSLREPGVDSDLRDTDRAPHPTGLLENLRSLARWQRALHIVR